jgi:hypothetical protein
MSTSVGAKIAAVVALAAWHAAQAHHSYALFDGSKTLTVIGTVAKLEWINPHVFLWVYVPREKEAGQYDLYAFENGSPLASSKVGWSATAVRAGDRITVDYWPLRDGRKGGHLKAAKLPDGRILEAFGGPAPRSQPPP